MALSFFKKVADLANRVRRSLLRDHCNLTPPTAYSQQQMSTPTKDRSHWPVKVFTCFEKSRAYRIQQWQDAGAAARHKAAWELVYDYWVDIKKINPDELRFQRSITFFKRGES